VAGIEGFLPCFSHYVFDKYPVSGLFQNSVYMDRLRALLSCALDAQNPCRLSADHGIGKAIKPIRSGDAESDRIIREIDYPYQMYRIDYGDNPFRIVFGFTSTPHRVLHVLAIDVGHSTYSGKIRR
jgi:hypothetical protein